MEGNDAGFSALDVHGQLPSLPPLNIAIASDMIAQNAREFGEESPPPFPTMQSVSSTLPLQPQGLEGSGLLPEMSLRCCNKVQENAVSLCARTAAGKATWRRRARGLPRILPVPLSLPRSERVELEPHALLTRNRTLLK